MHFKKRNSLRITSKFLITKERVVFMSVTEKDIRDCLDALVNYGNSLKQSLEGKRKEYLEQIKQKVSQFDSYRAGFSDDIVNAYSESINFESETTFDGAKTKITNFFKDMKDKAVDKKTLRNAERQVLSLINKSKSDTEPLKQCAESSVKCNTKLKQITVDAIVNPKLKIAGVDCNFSDLKEMLTKTLADNNNESFLEGLKNESNIKSIVDAFKRAGVVNPDNVNAIDASPYIHEYLVYLENYGKAIQSYLKVNRRICQAGIKKEVEKLAKYFPILATAHETDMVIKRGASADEAKQDIEGVISKIALKSSTVLKETKNLEMLASYFPTFISEIATQDIEGVISKIALKSSMALEQTKNNVDALIDKYLSVSSVEEDTKVKQFHKYCSDQLKKIQEHTKINPDVKIGEKTYKFIDLIDAVKTSVVNDPKSDILAVLASKSFENSIISSFIDAGVYVTERSL